MSRIRQGAVLSEVEACPECGTVNATAARLSWCSHGPRTTHRLPPRDYFIAMSLPCRPTSYSASPVLPDTNCTRT
jgi:hypothetical protein